MTTGTGIAGAMSYQPREASSAPNECATCGKDFGEGASKVAAAIPGIGVVQYCDAKCAPDRSPAEEWHWMIERIRALEEALRDFAAVGRLIDGPFGPALFAEDDMAFQSGCAWTENSEKKMLTWGHFRRACAVLTNTDKGES